jgi:hypothetical protein
VVGGKDYVGVFEFTKLIDFAQDPPEKLVDIAA